MSVHRTLARETLVRLRSRVDGHTEAAIARTPGAIACGPGCYECCSPDLAVFGVEAERIASALNRLASDRPETRAKIRAQGRDETRQHCALLVDGLCSVYDERPLICRSHGLAVALPSDENPDETTITSCHHNYRQQPPPSSSVLVLDAINAPLAVLATMWDSAATRRSLTELARD